MMYICSVILLVFLTVESAFAGGSPKTIALDMTVEEYARPQPIFHHLRAGDTIVVSSEGWMKRWFTMLCPQVYFPPNEIAPMREYTLLQRNETQKFNPETVPGGTVEVNYQILNIIGHRMKKMPDAVLRLSVSPYRASCFGEADSIGTLRMKYIRDYLISVWEITPERISVSPSGKKKSNNNANKFWRNGQRYVRMSSDTPELLFVLESNDTAIAPTINEVQISSPNIHIDSSEIRSIIVLFGLNGNDISQLIFTKFPVVLPDFYGDFFYRNIHPNGMQCKVVLTNGDTLLSLRTPLTILPAEIHESVSYSCHGGRGGHGFKNYYLYFGTTTATSLSPLQAEELRMVLPKLLFDHTSAISISSNVEFGGNEGQNRKITMLRAKAIEKVVRSLLPSTSKTEIEINSNGSEYPLFDPSLPIGRNLNNCVHITTYAAEQ